MKRFADRALTFLIPIALLALVLVSFGLSRRQAEDFPGAPEGNVLTHSQQLIDLTRLNSNAKNFLQNQINENAGIPDYPAFINLRKSLYDATQALPPSSCLVVKEGDRELFAHNATIGLLPASGQKLIMGLAALLELGPNYAYTTQIRSYTRPVNGRLNGNLYLVGGGDPFLWTKDYFEFIKGGKDGIAYTSLENLADQITNQGITSISGAVVAKESRYDTERYPPSWPLNFRGPRVSTPISALVVNRGYNLLPVVEAEEEEAGTTTTTAGDEPEELSWQPSSDPATTAAKIFDDLLESKGVVIPFSSFLSAANPPILLAEVRSPPLSTILTNILSVSDNLASEMVLKEIGLNSGREGSTAAGIETMVEHLVATGIYPTRPNILPGDASGVSNRNRTTCQELIRVLEYQGPGSVSPLVKILSISGERGTLRNFLPNSDLIGKLSAKTGTWEGISSLTGFISPTGFKEKDRLLTFSYISNDTFSSTFSRQNRNELEEELTLAMLNYLR